MSTSKPLKTLSSPQNSHEIRSAFTRDGRFTNFKQVFFRTFHTHRIAARTFAFTVLSVLAWFTATTHALDISQGWRFTKGDTWLAEQREVFADISKPAQLSAGKSHLETLTFKPPAAGFYQVTCTFIRDGDETAISQSRMRGYAPEKMDRPTDSPKDMRTFWDKSIAAPAPTAFAAYNQLRNSKDYRVYPEAGHGTSPEHLVAKMAWIRERFALVK